MRIIQLSLPLRVAIPALMISSLPKRAIGFSFERGRFGSAVGGVLVGAGALVGFLLYGSMGLVGPLIGLWLLGSTGGMMLFNSWRSVAFVKPLCNSCRLLPVIAHHEALHLGGIGSDAEIWSMVRGKVTFDGLGLGDPAICNFCPIAKRLKER
jgi:hypothetical protein